MISHRLRGLVHLHATASTGVATTLLLSYASVVPYFHQISFNHLLYMLCVVAGMAASVRVLNVYGSRFHRLSWADAAHVTTRQVGYVALCIFAVMVATKDHAVSRLFIGSYLGLCWTLLLFFNHALPRTLSRIAFHKKRRLPTLFIGTTAQLKKLRSWLADKESLGIHPVGFLTSEIQADGEGTGIPFLGALSQLADAIEAKQVTQVIVLDFPRVIADGRSIVEICQEKGCRVLIYNNLGEQLNHPLTPVSEDGHHFYTLQDEALEDPMNRVFKRCFDVLMSLPVVLFILPPLCLWVWGMQRFQAPGSLFFVQRRSGHQGNHFKILKFRSMYEKAHDARESQQARKGDDRVFSFGKFLRRTSLDEFPQFINVLKGDMSIVGPRPHMPAHDQIFSRMTRAYRTRFFVRPGITGLAQVRGYRGEISEEKLLHERFQHDLGYITNWSIWLDIQITLKTAWQVLFPPKAAY